MVRNRRRSEPLVGMPSSAREAGRSSPTWFWWSSESGGRSRAEEEMLALARDEQAQLAAVITRIIRGETRGGDVKPLVGDVLEARARLNGVFLRAAFARWGGHFVGLTVFKKKKNQTEPQDVRRASDRLKQWRDTHEAPPRSPST